jgi:hypothetical protein
MALKASERNKRSQIVFGLSDDDLRSLTSATTINRKSIALGMDTSLRNEKKLSRNVDIDSQVEYKGQLDADKDCSIIATRKPYHRTLITAERGLIIGDQSDTQQLKLQKIQNARTYWKQLDADLSRKIISLGRDQKTIREDVPSIRNVEAAEPESFESSMMTSFEPNMSITKYLHSPVKLTNEKSRFPRRGELAENNDTATFCIGGDAEVLKKKHKEMRQQYLTLLNADNIVAESSPRKSRNELMEEVYLNRTGWTGFDIGGCASNKANEAEEMLTRRMNQQEYARLLSVQMEDAAEKRSIEKIQNLAAPNYLAKLPYMSSKASLH